MKLSSRPVQNPAVLARKMIDGEMVLVNADNAASLALTTRSAVLIWEMVDGRNSAQDIVARMSQQFQNVPDTVADDVLRFLDQLALDGFIGLEWNDRE